MIQWAADHLLTCIIFLPAAGAGLLWLLPEGAAGAARRFALALSAATLILSIGAAGRYLRYEPIDGGTGGVVLEERADWIVWPPPSAAATDAGIEPTLRIQYSVGLDGISLPLLLLTALLTPLAILASGTSIRERARDYFGLLLLLHSAMLGVFCARDLLLFFMFFEFTLVPLYFIIAIWGGAERRRAANMFFIYTLCGSVFTFAGLLYVAWLGYHHAPEGAAVLSFDMNRLTQLASDGLLTPGVQFWLFLAFFAGFAVKVPVFPMHTWLPLAHTEAPTAGSALLAGVLLKLGTYGFLRVSLPMFPDAARTLAPWMALLAIVGIIYGALAAWVQKDIKKLVAYSSVSHLGFCVLGLFSLNLAGLTGALLYMVNHGLSTAALFFVVGMVYERYHTRQVDQIGGLARKMPWLSFFLVVFTLASIGLPGMNGFVSEFLVLLGTFTSAQAVGRVPAGPLGIAYAAFAATGIMLSAVYMLHMCRCVLFGPEKEPEHGFDRLSGLSQDLTRTEIGVLAPIALLCVLLGVLPDPVEKIMQPALERQTLSRIIAAADNAARNSPDVLERDDSEAPRGAWRMPRREWPRGASGESGQSSLAGAAVQLTGNTRASRMGPIPRCATGWGIRRSWVSGDARAVLHADSRSRATVLHEDAPPFAAELQNGGVVR